MNCLKKIIKPLFFSSAFLFSTNRIVSAKPHYQKKDWSDFVSRYETLSVAKSPSVGWLIDQIRDYRVDRADYRRYADRLITVLLEEALVQLSTKETVRESAFGTYSTTTLPIEESKVTVISIMRSANSMVEKFQRLCPYSKVGKVLVQRDEESEDKHPVFYYSKLPKDIASDLVVVVDPMVGTGGSANMTIECLLKEGVKEENIMFVNILSCKEGIEAILNTYPKVRVLTGCIDNELLPNKYLAPGLGDFGDRYFGTE